MNTNNIISIGMPGPGQGAEASKPVASVGYTSNSANEQQYL